MTLSALRFYDEIGLLKPAFVAESGYRYYQEKELLLLQQILFFRELGFELKQIRHIMKQSEFDRLATLQSHKKQLKQEIKRLQTLMGTIDKTINHIQGKQKMSEKELFYGLQNYSPEYQKFYREYQSKLSGPMKEWDDQFYEWQKGLSAQEHAKFKHDMNQFWADLVSAFKKGLKHDHPETQRVAKIYVEFCKLPGVKYSQKQWTVAAETMRAMPENMKKTIEKFPEFAPRFAEQLKRYDDNPGLADFMADAIKLYVERNLSD